MGKDDYHLRRTGALEGCGFVQGCAGNQTSEILALGALPGVRGAVDPRAGARYETQSWERCLQALGCPLICQVG